MATTPSKAADFFEEFVEATEPRPGSMTQGPAPDPAPSDQGVEATQRPRRWGLLSLGLMSMAICAAIIIGLSLRPHDGAPPLQSSPEAASPSTQQSDTSGAAQRAPSTTLDADRSQGNETGPVSLVVHSQRLVLEGTVDSEELRDTFFIAVSQLATDDLRVENNLRVEPGVGTEMAIGLHVTDAVLFDTDSAEISDEFATLLNGVASVLALAPEASVRVAGHTDITGNDDINEVLSLARASAVVDYLAARGVPADQLEAVGHGSSRPIADNSTPEGRQQNRRIEIEIDMKPEDP